MKKRYIAIGLACVMLTTFVACSKNTIAELEDALVDEQDAIDNPQFWNVSTLVGDNTNLYSINNSAFVGKPYVNVCKYGDRLLLVGMGYYDTSETDYLDEWNLWNQSSDEENYDEENYSEEDYDDSYGDIDYSFDEDSYTVQYSFDVYDPWRDSITASIDPGIISNSEYSVLPSGKLITYTYDENGDYTLTVYDEDLEETASTSIDFSLAIGAYELDDPDKFYCVNYGNDSLVEFSITDDGSITTTEYEIPLYVPSLVGASQDGSYLVVSGYDPNTLRSVLVSYVPATGETKEIINSTDSIYGSYNGNSSILAIDLWTDIWKTNSLEGSSYFIHSGYSSASLSTGAFVLDFDTYDEDSNTTTYQYCMFDASGDCMSGFTIEPDTSTDDNSFRAVCENIVVFEDQQLAFFLEYDSDLNPHVLVWDYANSGIFSQELTFYSELTEAEDHCCDEYGQAIYTAVSDREHHDFGNLIALRTKADEMEQKYGVKIYIADEVPEEIGGYTLAQNFNYEEISSTLDQLDAFLDLFPAGFLDQLCIGTEHTLSFYITGTISASSDGMLSEAAAFVTDYYSRKAIVIDAYYDWDLDYTLPHEFSHIIDRRLEFVAMYDEDNIYSEDTWASFNGSDFEYQYNYSDDYYDADLPDDVYCYFLDLYGTTYPTEDRAILFGRACEAYLSSDYYISESFVGPIDEKYEYYCDCIRADFDTTGWPSTCSWECLL